MCREITFAVCGLLLLALGQAHAARSLKEASVAHEVPHGLGLADRLLATLAQRWPQRALRQVGDAGLEETDGQQRDYNLINRGPLPYSAAMLVGNTQAMAGYRGDAAAAQAFAKGGYGGYLRSPAGFADPYYDSALINRPYDSGMMTSRTNLINARMNSANPFDI